MTKSSTPDMSAPTDNPIAYLLQIINFEAVIAVSLDL